MVSTLVLVALMIHASVCRATNFAPTSTKSGHWRIRHDAKRCTSYYMQDSGYGFEYMRVYDKVGSEDDREIFMLVSGGLAANKCTEHFRALQYEGLVSTAVMQDDLAFRDSPLYFVEEAMAFADEKKLWLTGPGLDSWLKVTKRELDELWDVLFRSYSLQTRSLRDRPLIFIKSKDGNEQGSCSVM
ncbi:hypothetical protein THOM_0655 [Trachipleistophora hominis]|uniref:Uncharacterized protein n=1 Tax=Trachipleistophora hominis TaxID=72359 RepID=L7JXZ9_TRAHO|nr:hypothetical protein THOM_0655 [Trachipleistophora hominis]